MLLNLNQVTDLISEGKLLHIAASEDLLLKLPQGSWIGGSTEYFMGDGGGVISNELLFVDELPAVEYTIRNYDETNMSELTHDAYGHGYSVIILPFDSEAHKYFARNAATFDDIFLKNVIGWVSGTNLAKEGQTPLVINGFNGSILKDQAVVIHASLQEDQLVQLGIVNIFKEYTDSPVLEFPEDTFSVTTCRINGEEVVFADFIAEHNIDTQLPLIGDYSGVGINISIKSIEDGVVHLYAPVFSGISYKLAQNIADYAAEFRSHLERFEDVTTVFSCNCVLNFLYGGLEGKDTGSFTGPITFGEVAYQLVNQTLVYLVIL